MENYFAFLLSDFRFCCYLCGVEGEKMDCSDKSKSRKEFDETVRHISAVVRQMEKLRSAMNTLCECFLLRANDNDDDPLWRRFYTIQMSSYLCSKKNLEVSAPEGDMVHDLIRCVWEEDVKDYMNNSKFGPISNVDQWFRTIRIDFPMDPFDPCCAFFHGKLTDGTFSLCQKDAKQDNCGEVVSN